MAENVLLEKAKDFAVEIVNLCRGIQSEQREYVLTGQLLRCGTSIGANLHEANYAQSRALKDLQTLLLFCYDALFNSISQINMLLILQFFLHYI